MNWYRVFYNEVDMVTRRPLADLSGGILYTDKDIYVDQSKPLRRLGPYEVSMDIDVRELRYMRLDIGIESNINKRCIGDCIGYNLRRNFVFSSNFLDLFKNDTLRFPKDSVCIPFRFSFADNPLNLDREFCVMWAGRMYDSLNLDDSEVQYYEGAPDVIQDVICGAFDVSKMPKADIFLMKEARYWIANQRVVDAVCQHSLKGFDFVGIGSDRK